MRWNKVKHVLYLILFGWIVEFIKEVIKVSKVIGWFTTVFVVIGVVGVFYSPAIYGLIVGDYAISVAYIAFWALPFTPAMGIMFGTIWGILKLIDRRVYATKKR